MISKVSYFSKVSFTAMAAAMVFGMSAEAQELCEIYTIEKGDTLSDIARRADLAGGYQVLYSANRDVLNDPTIIEIGVKLKIPCENGSLPIDNGVVTITTNNSVSEIKPTPQSSNAAPATSTPIRYLTGSNYAPFTDENMPEQGMITELVKRGTELGNPDQEYRVTFINDWGSHLTELLPMGAFDAGFPWFLPDCSKVENLSPVNAMRCTEFDASDPLFEALVGYYTLKGSQYEGVTSYEQLFNARVCRPEAWFTFDLEAERLVEPNITRLKPEKQVECWEALLAGEADIVTFDALPAEADIEMLNLQDKVTELSDISGVATMHVFTPKSNPNGKAYLATLNAGLEQMRTNGQWFAIVSKHLAAQ